MVNIRETRLQDQVFTQGATVSIQVAGQLPPGRRVLGVHFSLLLDITQPAAGAAAQLGAVLHQLIAQVKIGRLVSVTGLGMRIMQWMQSGRSVNLPAGFPTGVSTVFSRKIDWYLMLYDISAGRPDDCAIPTEIWTDPIEVRFGTAAIFAATVPSTIGNGVLRTYVYHDLSRDAAAGLASAPALVNIQSDDFNALTAIVNKPGTWVYAALYREASNDAGGISSAQVSNLISYVDGDPIFNNVTAQDMASTFNGYRAQGDTLQVESQTVPVGGEAINDQPGAGAAAGQAIVCDFLPLLFPPWGYTLTQCPAADLGAKFEMAGTLGAYKIVYRIVEHQTESRVESTVQQVAAGSGSRAVPASFVPKHAVTAGAPVRRALPFVAPKAK